MITNSIIATGDQLGAQMSTLAALMYIGIQNDQEVVFWEELKDYKRGFQFLEAFDISGIRLIKRCGRVEDRLLNKYNKLSSQSNDWKKQMNRIYRSRIYRFLDSVSQLCGFQA